MAPSAVGGKKGQKLYRGLIPLISAAAGGQYLISLDHTLAFDCCDPRLTVHIFRQSGLPRNCCNMLLQQWTNQQRILTFDGFCLPTYEHVNCSLPQGGPFSLIAMVCDFQRATTEHNRRATGASGIGRFERIAPGS